MDLADTPPLDAPPVTGEWRDRKRYLWLTGLVVPGLGMAALLLYTLTRWSWVPWTGPIIVLIVVPLVDLMVGLDAENPPEEAIARLEADRYYRWVNIAYLPMQYVVFLGGMAVMVGHNPIGATLDALGLGRFTREHLPALMEPLALNGIDKFGLAVSVGVVGGIAIAAAHELGHKRDDSERWLARIALAQTFYGHFYIEHNRGHHVRVATPEDPASARMGESFYRFWPRTVFGSLRSAWNVERRRFARRGQHPFRWSNDVLNAWAMSVVLWGAMIAAFGWALLPYLVIQAVAGFSLLEVVNYMEHYGMLRQKVGRPGQERYERVTPEHSWNSNNLATNLLLYHLQRHSDHHANPTRRYQSLRDFPQAPVLPTGYAGMIVLALVPPLWRRVMDARVVAHYDGDVTRANIQPGRRERLLARFPAPRAGGDTGPVADTVGTAIGAASAVQCPGCGYRYEVAVGDEREGFAPGTAWADVPEDWSCPDCGVRDKKDFVRADEVSA